ncbi:MAG: acyltransferase [Planctomyces sp.]
MQNISLGISNRLHTLRALFTFFVVGIHTTPSNIEIQGALLFSVSILLDALYRTAVPGFFLLTGYLSLQNAEPSLKFYRTRFSRIFPAWLFWSLIYLAYRVTFLNQQISFASAIRCFISGDTYYHLWFMYRMAGIYLALPVISLLTVRSSSTNSLCAIGLAFVFNQLAPDIGHLATTFTGHNFQPAVAYPLGDRLVLFVITGGLLRSWTNSDVLRNGSGLVFFSTYTTLSVISLLRSFSVGHLDESTYFASLITPMAVAFFMAGLRFLPGRTLAPALRVVSDASFGIYLAHPLIFELLQRIPVPPLSNRIPIWNTSVVFLTSLLAVHLLRRISLLRILT